MRKIQILTEIPANRDYPKKAFEILYEIEKKHFWFSSKNEVIKIIIERVIRPTKNFSFLEVGCGNGIVLEMLENFGFSLTGLDVNIEGLKIASRRTNATLICADIYKLKYRNKYEAIGLFDVIEHIQDDKHFLKKCGEMLSTKGVIILTVPANMRLWSRIDKISGHKRRYDKSNLAILLDDAGYKIEFVSYFNCLLYVPQLLFRKFSKRVLKEKNDENVLMHQLKIPPSFINTSLKWLCLLEAQLLRITSIPFGTSLIIVGSKKD